VLGLPKRQPKVNKLMSPFAEYLRRLRSDRGLSLAALGRLVTYSGAYMWDLENDRRRPNPDLAVALDTVLTAGGRLAAHLDDHPAAAEAPPGLPDWTEADRTLAGVSGHVRPDSAMAEYLAGSLAFHRRAEDTAGARMVLQPVLAQLATVEALRAAANGDLHDLLLGLEAQYAQFVGWLYQDMGDRPVSEQWYARALSRAHEAGDDDLIASVLSMRSNAAWGAGDAKRAVTLAEASCRVTVAAPGVRALSHQQLARAYAASGDRARVDAHLDEAVALSDRARLDPGREPAWTYFLDEGRLTIQRAICLRELGEHRAAVDLFRQAIESLPAEYRRDRGQYLARLAVALRGAGEREESAEVEREARHLADVTGSARTLAELGRLKLAA
jgi:tetratricopeptide (TPR) repeat protein